eukprot:2900927-Amphidinium_carterae.1
MKSWCCDVRIASYPRAWHVPSKSKAGVPSWIRIGVDSSGCAFLCLSCEMNRGLIYRSHGLHLQQCRQGFRHLSLHQWVAQHQHSCLTRVGVSRWRWKDAYKC